MSKFARIFAFLCLFLGTLFAAVNINTASVDELKSLKGIGDKKAMDIVAYRTEQNFTTIDDLKKVKGIGEKLFNAIKEDIVVE